MVRTKGSSKSKANIIYVQEAHKANRNGITVHEAMAPIILFGQIFSLIPMTNYFQSSPEKVKFTIRSVRLLYSCITIASISSIIVMFLLYVIGNKSFGLNTTG